jgi:hypothetical protein
VDALRPVKVEEAEKSRSLGESCGVMDAMVP